VQLLKESTTTDDGNKDVIDVDSTSVVLHNTDDPLLVYPFKKFDIEKATKVLDLCRGTGAALDEKKFDKEEIQVLRYS
jgi:hypothetical protein